MYLYDTHQKVRAVLKDAVTEWIHHERKFTLDAAIRIGFAPRPGEYVGFACVDDRWRLFCIDKVQEDDEKNLAYIEATDAAVDDLNSIIIPDAYQENVTAKAAAEKLLSGTEWALGTVTTGSATNTTDAQYVTLWAALETMAKVFGVQVVPYYIIEDAEVKEKRLDLLADTPEYRGRFFESENDASAVVVTYNQRPYTVMYGLGKATGVEAADRMTIAGVVWNKANGDPADKPAGQTWVEDPEAAARYGRRERVMVSDNARDEAELMRLTWEALQEECKPKVSVDAMIRDMEQIKGQKHKAVRMGDMVYVRTKRGEDVEARIIGIDRDYVEPDRTKIAAGKEMPTGSQQIASLARAAIHTKETLTINKNRFLQDEALIQLNADTILANAKEIHEAAEEIITLKAGNEETAAKLLLMDGKIEANAQEILLKADKIDLQGYVTLEKFEALEAEIDDLFASDLIVHGGLSADSITAGRADIDDLLFGTINGKDPDEWVAAAATEKGFATQSWVRNQGYATHTYVTTALKPYALVTETVKKGDIKTQEITYVYNASLEKSYDNVPGADGVGHVVISGVSLTYNTAKANVVVYA